MLKPFSLVVLLLLIASCSNDPNLEELVLNPDNTTETEGDFQNDEDESEEDSEGDGGESEGDSQNDDESEEGSEDNGDESEGDHEDNESVDFVFSKAYYKEYGTTVFGWDGYWNTLTLFTEGLDYEVDASGFLVPIHETPGEVGTIVVIDIYSETTLPSTGQYHLVSNNFEPWTFSESGYFCFGCPAFDGSAESYNFSGQGIIDIEKNNSDYIIQFTIEIDNGEIITGYYSGNLTSEDVFY